MPTLSTNEIEAVIFDMDGVITRTAEVHAAAWQATFDEVLEAYAERTGDRQPPFDPVGDYLRHVDGKPRRDGIRDFLAARGIELPEGSGEDRGLDTVEGIAHRKNQRFHEHLEAHGAQPFDSTVDLVRLLRERGIRTAVISSSRNAAAVLRAAGVSELFETRVSGVEMAELGLPGKPEPDIFLEAARRLAASPGGTAVVEDAESGVRAGRAGDFAVVIGVARGDNERALLEAGADFVVTDLAEIQLAG